MVNVEIFSKTVRAKGTMYPMDKTHLMVALFFTFILGAGIGFYVAKLIF